MLYGPQQNSLISLQKANEDVQFETVIKNMFG